MAMLWADGFEDGLNWGYEHNTVTTVGRSALALDLGYTAYCKLRTGGTASTICLSFAAFFSASAGYEILCLRGDNDTVPHLYVHMDPGYILRFVYGENLYEYSCPMSIAVNQWSHIEIQFVLSNSAGLCRAWSNGVLAGEQIGIDTRNGGVNNWIDTVEFKGGSHPDNTWKIDDLVVYDDSGSYNKVPPIGDSVVEHLHPASPDVGTPGWMGGDGNQVDNWDMVNEIGDPAMTGNDYVSSSTVGAKDVYNLTNAFRATGTVVGVMGLLAGDSTDVTLHSVKALLQENPPTGVTRLGSVFQLPYGSVAVAKVLADRKDDGTPWLVADLNLLGVGVELTV